MSGIPVRTGRFGGRSSSAHRTMAGCSGGIWFAVIAALLAGTLIALSFAASPGLALAPALPFGLFAMILAACVLLKAARGSRAAIITVLAIVVFLSDAQLRVRGAGDTTVDWQSLLKLAVWMSAGLVGIAWLPSPRRLLSQPGSACLLIYIYIALLSAFYAPSFVYSLGCALAVGALFAFAFTLVARLSVAEILWTTVLSLAVFLIAGWIVFAVNPELGASPFWTVNGMYNRFCGISGQADNMGSVCAKYIGAVFLLWRMGRCRWWYAAPLAGLGFASLLASDARTGMIAVMAGVGAVLLPRTRWGLLGGALMVLLLVMLSLGSPAQLAGLTKSFSRSGDPTELYTLTGRLEIWNFAEEQILESPVFGYGYNSSKVVLGQHLGFQNGLMVDTAHNLWLQNMLSVGLLGTLPMVALYIWLLVQYVRRPCDFRDFCTVTSFVAGLADNQAFGTTPTVLMMIFMVACVLPEPPRFKMYSASAARPGYRPPRIAVPNGRPASFAGFAGRPGRNVIAQSGSELTHGH